jgi:hypothetical protein
VHRYKAGENHQVSEQEMVDLERFLGVTTGEAGRQ